MIALAGVAIIAMSAFFYFNRPSAGDPAPDFSVKSIEGQTISLHELKGKPFILHFWATWCSHCVHELPSLIKFAHDYSNADFKILAVSEDGEDARYAVGAFMKQFHTNISVILDDGQIAEAYYSDGVPSTVIVNSNGIITLRWEGGVNWNSHTVRKKIFSALGITKGG